MNCLYRQVNDIEVDNIIQEGILRWVKGSYNEIVIDIDLYDGIIT
jgi:hypothetical protein